MKISKLLAIAVTTGMVGLASPAGAVIIEASDAIGSQFTVDFDGNVNGSDVPGLTSTAIFTFEGADSDSFDFSVALSNTSSGGITSETAALGFDVAPDLFDASVFGDFSNVVLGGSFPNGFGAIEVCFTNGPTCQGGASGGVETNDTFEFDIELIFSTLPDSIELTNFGVRYQAISGNGFNGASGTGRGTVPPPPTQAPEPGTLALLGAGLLAIGGMLRRRS